MMMTLRTSLLMTAPSTPAAVLVFPSRLDGDRRLALAPQHPAGREERKTVEEVDDPHVLFPEHGVGQVRVEEPNLEDAEQHHCRHREQESEEAPDDAFGRGLDRAGDLLLDLADRVDDGV